VGTKTCNFFKNPAELAGPVYCSFFKIFQKIIKKILTKTRGISMSFGENIIPNFKYLHRQFLNLEKWIQYFDFLKIRKRNKYDKK
jgi:hypothetical protein